MEYSVNNQKWQESLEKAKYHFRIADHMAYVTITLLKDNRLIIKILSELAESVRYIISAFLQNESLKGKIRLSKDPKINLKIFVDNIAPKILERGDIENVIKILDLRKKHEESHSEFVKKEKLVILLGDKYEVLTLEKLREIMASARKLMIRTSLLKNT